MVKQNVVFRSFLMLASLSFGSELIAQDGGSPALSRSTKADAIFLNMNHLQSCGYGFGAAAAFGVKGESAEFGSALANAKMVCVDDIAVSSIYSAMHNGGDIDNLGAAREFAEEQVAKHFFHSYKGLMEAKRAAGG